MKCAITTVSITLTMLANMSDAVAQTKPGTTRWLYEQCSSADPKEQDTCSAYLLGVAGVMETAGFVYEPPEDGTKGVGHPAWCIWNLFGFISEWRRRSTGFHSLGRKEPE
jgi:hypothetical protein